jgi:hypothetical protein
MGVRGVFVCVLVWPHAALAAATAEPAEHSTAGASESRATGEGANEPAPANPMSFGASLALLSRGLWRGLTLGTPAVLETSVDVGYGAASLGVVSSAFVGAHVRPGGQMAGFDMNLAYDIDAAPFVFAPALNVFSYPGAGQTSEVSLATSVDLGTLGASAGADGLGHLSVHTQEALDFMSNRGGWYAEGGVAWSKELGWQLALDVELSVSCYSGAFARFYVDESITGARVGAAALGSGLTYPATDWLSLTLQGSASTLLDGELRRAAGSQAQLAAGGVAVGVSY